MGAILYYLMTFAEAGLGVVGIRTLYEQPPYTVVERLPGGVEVRDYPPRTAAETDDAGDGAAAFNRLFRYITGSNATGALIEMTAPVSQAGRRIPMTIPVQSSAGPGVMRFFLPRDTVAKGPPAPLDPAVRLINIPAERLAVLRFSGIPQRSIVDGQKQALMAALSRAGRSVSGEPSLLTYDAPFTIPFLRRNEVAVAITSRSGASPP